MESVLKDHSTKATNAITVHVKAAVEIPSLLELIHLVYILM